MDQKYIAFISYRHNPVDKAAAVKIQTMIERYRIPKKMRKNGQIKPGIVFRDEDELNISASLSDELCNAIDNSEYLIVICTPEYKQSKWCRQEISYFLQTHDIDHVLPILVSGTPKESFPDELFRYDHVDGKKIISEPLAANVAGDTIEQIEKNISREYLRIIARVLECNYGELVQRQRRYEIKKRLIVSTIVFGALIAFIAMLLVKNRQINEQYQESRKNQALNLATLSLEQYKKGNRQEALENALTILPEGKENGPVVPKQLYALSTATNVYNSSYAPVDYIKLAGGKNQIITDDLLYYYSYSGESVNKYTLDKQELLCSFSVKDFLDTHPDMEGIWGYSTIRGVEHIDENHFLLMIDGNVFSIDTTNESLIKRIYQDTENINKTDYANGKVAICNYDAKLVITEVETGKILYQKNFNQDSDKTGIVYSIKDISFNKEGTSIAVGFEYEYTPLSEDNLYHSDLEINKLEEEYFDKNPPYGTIVIDINSQKVKTLSSNRTIKVFYEDNFVAGEHYAYPTTLIKTYPAALDPIRHHFASVYSVNDGTCIFTSDMITSEASNTFGFEHGMIDYNKEAIKVCLVWIGNKGAVIDEKSKEILYTDAFHSDVIRMGTINDYNVDFVLSEGSISHMLLADDSNFRTNRLKLDQSIYGAWAKDGEYYLRPDGSDILIRCVETEWDGYKEVKTKDPVISDLFVSDVSYEETKAGIIRVVKYQDKDQSYTNSNCSGVELYQALSVDPLFSYTPTDPKGVIAYCAVSEDGNDVTIIEQTSDLQVIISRYLISDGSLVFKDVNSDMEELGYNCVTGSTSDRSYLFFIKNRVNYKDILYLYNTTNDKVSLETYEAESYIYNPELISDNNHIVWFEQESSMDSFHLATYDLSTHEKQVISIPESMNVSYSTMILPLNESKILIYTGKTEAMVIDVQSQTILPSFEVDYGSKINYLASSDELIVSNGNRIDLIDFESRELLSQIELDEIPYKIETDSNKEMFEAKIDSTYRSSNDDGWCLASSYLISIDENRQMNPSFHIVPYNNTIYFSPHGGEIVIVQPKVNGSFLYDHVLEFEEVVDLAEGILSCTIDEK